MNSELNSALEN